MHLYSCFNSPFIQLASQCSFDRNVDLFVPFPNTLNLLHLPLINVHPLITLFVFSRVLTGISSQPLKCPSMHGMMFNDSVILPLLQVQQPFIFFTSHVTLSPSLNPFPNSSMHEPLQSGPATP